MDAIETKERPALQRGEDVDKAPIEPVLSRKTLLNVLDDRATVEEFVSVRPYTFVKIRSWYNRREYVGFGFSKVCYPDKWDAEDGADIAKHHALINILHQIRTIENREDVLPF